MKTYIFHKEFHKNRKFRQKLEINGKFETNILIQIELYLEYE